MIYVLLILSLSHVSNPSSMQEFSSKFACEYAKTRIDAAIADGNNRIFTICVPR